MRHSDQGPQIIRTPGSNIPIPVGRDTDLAQRGAECLETVANDLYDGDVLEYLGKTRLEVAVLSLAKASEYDSSARTEFLDRAMGKPKQRVDSTSVTVNLTDFLHQLAEEDHNQARDSKSEVVIDAEPGIPNATETEDGLPFLC